MSAGRATTTKEGNMPGLENSEVADLLQTLTGELVYKTFKQRTCQCAIRGSRKTC